MHIKSVSTQAAQLSILFMEHLWRGTFNRNLLKDKYEYDQTRWEQKAQHPAASEPTTPGIQGECSTTALVKFVKRHDIETFSVFLLKRKGKDEIEKVASFEKKASGGLFYKTFKNHFWIENGKNKEKFQRE